MMKETTYTIYHKPCGTALSRPLSGGPITPEQLDEIFNGCICANCPDPIGSISELEVRSSPNLKGKSCKCEAAIVINDEAGNDVFRLSNEDLKDLMELSKELQQQENHYQAFPYYWSPASEKLETNIHGEGEVIEVLYEGSVTCTPEEFAESGFDDHDYERGHVCDYEKFIIGNDLVFEGKYLKSLERDWVEYIENEIDGAEIWTSDYRENVENNPSFFLSDIKDYIKHNKHHLGRNPHTYAQTIFRMPKMEKLMKILYRLNPQP